MYVYSDGLTEAEDQEGELFGQECFEPLLQDETNHRGRIEGIKESVRIFTDGAGSTDDVSLIEIKNTGHVGCQSFRITVFIKYPVMYLR